MVGQLNSNGSASDQIRLRPDRRPGTAFDIEHTFYGECCNTLGSVMNKNETARIHELCSLIALEQNREQFLKLVQELNRLLAAKESTLEKKIESSG